ncbi:MAG: hypothetical protein J6X44_06820 [Thermoguttaceae bacterium]|nr:hypothetical protein [Thermoguttaceae bacterium]
MRSKVGWIAVAMIALVVYGILRYKTTGDASFFELNRTCVIMILLWLAWPELEALPRWMLYAVPICVGVCAWRPQYLFIVVPATFIFLLLRPPAKKRKKTKR